MLCVGICTALTTGVAVAADINEKPLSGPALHRLVVAPPAPFAPLPDSVLKTGLMEFGNPKSGKIGTVVSTQRLKKAKFQRGWESVFRSPDGAAVYVDVFEFATVAGAKSLVQEVERHIPSTYSRVSLGGLPSVFASQGTSPQGNAVTAAVFSLGRFFVFQVVGGPPTAHDYRGLSTNLAAQQLGVLPAT